MLTRSRRDGTVGEPSTNGHRPAPVEKPRGRDRRRLVLAGRTVLWAVILLLAVRGGLGVLGELTGDGVQGTPPVAGQAPVQESAVPLDAARAFATRFAQDYLTYDSEAGRAERAERLAAYVPAEAERDLGWDGRGSQSVRAVLPVGVDVGSQDRVVVTVAAQVGEGRWVHLAVPVTADAAGGMVVGEPPALVAGPPRADVGSGSWAVTGRSSGDVALAEELGPALESFFEAYGQGRPDALAYYLAVGRDLDGLGGLVQLDELVSLWVGRGEAVREAVATVRWRDESTGGALTQRYTLRLVDGAGRWYVDALGVGEGIDSDEGDEEGSRS